MFMLLSTWFEKIMFVFRRKKIEEVYAEEETEKHQPPGRLWSTQRDREDNVCFFLCVLVCKLILCLRWIPFMRRGTNLPGGLWTTQGDRERVGHEDGKYKDLKKFRRLGSANLPRGLWTTQQDREGEEINLFEMDPRPGTEERKILSLSWSDISSCKSLLLDFP